jgi:hypothetical protein
VRRRGRLRRLPAGAVCDGAPPVIAIDAAAGAAAKAATPDSAEVRSACLLVCCRERVRSALVGFNVNPRQVHEQRHSHPHLAQWHTGRARTTAAKLVLAH